MDRPRHQFAILALLFSLALVFAACATRHARGQQRVNGSSAGTAQYALSQEELASLAKPAVVRIVQHTEGKATIKPFKIDLKNLAILPDPGGQPTVFTLDEYITGSGFVINSDGYVMTNSHVISYQTVKLSVIYRSAYDAIMVAAASMSEEDQQKTPTDEEKLDAFGDRVVEYLLKESSFDIKKSLAVLNPSSQKEKLADLFAEGFPAKTISVYDDFYKDNQDAAIIKIDQRGLPSIKIGDPASVKMGEKIYIFGFPATAEFNQKNLLESTFTQGVVSAFKDSENKDFKIFQTDAKVSQGSSGGPLLNGSGEVIGLITYQTGELDQGAGDNFAFAIPITIARQIVEKNYLSQLSQETARPVEGGYFSHFRSGLDYLLGQNCASAIKEFNLAKQGVNPDFQADRQIDPYIERCRVMIASGSSIDSDWDVFRNKIRSTDYFIWILAGVGGMMVIVLVAVILVLVARISKEEKEIAKLEHTVDSINQKIGSPEKPAVPTNGNTPSNNS